MWGGGGWGGRVVRHRLNRPSRFAACVPDPYLGTRAAECSSAAPRSLTCVIGMYVALRCSVKGILDTPALAAARQVKSRIIPTYRTISAWQLWPPLVANYDSEICDVQRAKTVLQYHFVSSSRHIAGGGRHVPLND